MMGDFCWARNDPRSPQYERENLAGLANQIGAGRRLSSVAAIDLASGSSNA
jgi:hypothetical protein